MGETFFDNVEAIEAWNTVLFDKFVRFRATLTTSLARHSDELMARHPPPVGGRRLVPGGDVAAERGLGLLQARDGVVDRVGQGVGVGAVDVGPDRRVGAGHPRHVAEARARCRQSVAADRGRSVRDEDVREHVREMRHRRQHPVVRGRVASPPVDQEPGHALARGRAFRGALVRGIGPALRHGQGWGEGC